MNVNEKESEAILKKTNIEYYKEYHYIQINEE